MPIDGCPFAVLARLPLRLTHRLRPHHEIHIGAEVGFTDLDDVVAFLAQAAGNGPATVHRDVDDDHSQPEVLHVRDHLREVLFRADHQSVRDGAVAGQRRQIAVDLALHTLPPPRPHAA